MKTRIIENDHTVVYTNVEDMLKDLTNIPKREGMDWLHVTIGKYAYQGQQQQGRNDENSVFLQAYYEASRIMMHLTIKYKKDTLFEIEQSPTSIDTGRFVDYIIKVLEVVNLNRRKYVENLRKTKSNIQILTTLPTKTFSFTSHEFGIARYQSRGKAMFSWLKLIDPSVHSQWLKLFWREGIVDIAKCIEQLKVLRTQTTQVYTDKPPKVRIVDDSCIPQMKDYLNKNHALLLNEAMSRPLNRSGAEESKEWEAVIIMKHSVIDSEMLPCSKVGDVADPRNDLWLVALLNLYKTRTLAGYAKSIMDPSLKSRVLRTVEDSRRYGKDSDKTHYNALVCMAPDKSTDPCKSMIGSPFKVGEEINDDDEYIDLILTTMIEEHKAKGK